MKQLKHKKVENAAKAEPKGAYTEPANIDKVKLKAAIDKIKDRKRPELELLQMIRQSKQAKLRRKLGRQLRSQFEGATFDAKKIDRALARNHAELAAALKKEGAAAAKKMGPIVKQQREGIANTRKALEQIQLQPLVTTPIPISTPYLIYAKPVGILTDTHTEPFNNWAKFFYSSDKNTAYSSVVVNFYFAWQNTSDYLAVINCSTNLIANGLIEDTADPGWFFPGSASLSLSARLTVFLGATKINYQGTQFKQMGSVFTEAGYSEIGSPGTISGQDVIGSFALSCSDIQVQPGQIVVFEVACIADWWIDEGGSITVSFDFDPAGRQLMCPALQVDLLTAPQGGLTTPVAS
jgi:hypothetical protein